MRKVIIRVSAFILTLGLVAAQLATGDDIRKSVKYSAISGDKKGNCYWLRKLHSEVNGLITLDFERIPSEMQKRLCEPWTIYNVTTDPPKSNQRRTRSYRSYARASFSYTGYPEDKENFL